MSRRPYHLPPLTALSAFEAAARHQSFKQAAQELNVTPGAISHQIRGLEAELGMALFHRVHRGIVLTEQGTQVFRVIRNSFVDISGVLAQLRSGGDETTVTIGATSAMSSYWLTPAISRFWRAHPEVRVNQVVSDKLDHASAVHDLAIGYGPIEDGAFDNTPLFRDTLVPVASPELAATLADPSPEALAAMPLIHLDAPDINWTTWERWFSEVGYTGPLRRGRRVNNYLIALQAAQDGVGMVLGWERLIAPVLATGRVQVVGQIRLPAPTAFFLGRDRRAAGKSGAEILYQWLLQEARGAIE